MKTGFWCRYELKDTTAIQDSMPTTAYNSAFADIAKVKDNVTFEDYATLEENYFLLDGTMPEFPDEPEDIVYFSSVLSGPDGTYATPPVIHILFSGNHTSIGLTFYFVGDHPLEMEITWRSLDGMHLAHKRFYVDQKVFFAKQQVENYGKLEIKFVRSKPCRYVKLRYIEYGTDLLFGTGGLPVKSAQLIEETDPISDKIAINKLTYKLIDENDEFNLGNIDGLHKVLQTGQQMEAYENVDGEALLLGKFFLSKHSTDKSVTNISCVDFKGLLDANKYRTGRVYHGEPAGPVIDDIMAAAGIADYTVDDETRETPLHGWLKIQTCRKALREVLFATGSVLDSSRSLSLNIHRQDRTIRTAVRRTRKFSTSVAEQDYISDVSIKFPVYTLAEEAKEVAKGSYQAGTYTLDLSSPAKDMTINTGEIIEQSDNYVTFRLPEAADIIISGKKYSKEDLTATASVKNVAAGHIRTSKGYNCTLVDAAQAAVIAEKILDYFSLRLSIKIKFLNEGDKPANWAEVYNTRKFYGNYVAGFEKITTDLTGGFVSTAELRGYYKLLSDYDYTGEIMTGEETGWL